MLNRKSLVRLYRSGLTGPQLAQMYGVHKVSIYKWLRESGESRRNYHDAQFRNYAQPLDISMFNPINELGAYYLGLLYADGYINNIRLSIGLCEADSAILHEFAADLCYKGNLYNYSNGSNRQRIVAFNTRSRNLIKILHNLGLKPGRTYKQNIPKLASRLYPHFVRGYSDGDGYVGSVAASAKKSPVPKIDLAIQYRRLALQFRNLIETGCGIKMNGPYHKSTIWALMASYRKAKAVGDWIYASPVRYMKRKYGVYKDWY